MSNVYRPMSRSLVSRLTSRQPRLAPIVSRPASCALRLSSHVPRPVESKVGVNTAVCCRPYGADLILAPLPRLRSTHGCVLSPLRGFYQRRRASVFNVYGPLSRSHVSRLMSLVPPDSSLSYVSRLACLASGKTSCLWKLPSSRRPLDNKPKSTKKRDSGLLS